MSTTLQDAGGLKCSLKKMWEAGDVGMIAKHLEPGALLLWNRLALPGGIRLLDVVCGNGQFTILAARDGLDTTGVDISGNLIRQARQRAFAEGLPSRFDEGDAENLPYEDNRFDVVLSVIGAMFAPDPERTAAELIRVCKPGGRIIMANWTPDGFAGQMLKIVGKHAPPPNIPSPLQWGNEAIVRERLLNRVKNLQLTYRMYPLGFPFPPSGVVDFCRTYWGPLASSFAALDASTQARLHQDLELLWREYNVKKDGTTQVDSEYLELIATKC